MNAGIAANRRTEGRVGTDEVRERCLIDLRAGFQGRAARMSQSKKGVALRLGSLPGPLAALHRPDPSVKRGGRA